MIKKWSVTKRKKETKNCSNYTKHTVDANKVCSYWSEKTKMFTYQMSEQELIVILKVRTRQQQNSWPSDKEFLEQIIDNPARTNEPKKRWEATLIVGILIIFSKIIFLLLPLRNHNWIFNEVFVYCSLRHVDSVTFSHGLCPWGFQELFLESIKIKEIPPIGWYVDMRFLV